MTHCKGQAWTWEAWSVPWGPTLGHLGQIQPDTHLYIACKLQVVYTFENKSKYQKKNSI